MEDIDYILGLLLSTDLEKRNSAFALLPENYPDQVTLALIEILRDEDLAIRQQSIDALISKGPSCLPLLIEALRIDDYDIKFNIIKILGAIGDSRATGYLVELIEDAPESLHYELIEALIRLKDAQVIDTLIESLGHKEPSIRELASNGLFEMGAHSLTALSSALQSPLWQTRLYAARTLGRIGDAQAVDPLIQALEHSDSTFRAEAIKALGLIGDRRAAPFLIQALMHSEPDTIRPLIEALARLMDASAIPQMIEAFKQEEWSNHDYIVDSIASMGHQAFSSVQAYAENASPRIRIGIAKILSRLNHANANEALVKLTRDTDHEVRLISAEALSKHFTPFAIEAMVELLADPINAVSSQAAKSLIQVAPLSRQPLVNALCHTNATIRRRAATLLCRKDLHKGARAPLELPSRITPYLMDSLRHERQYAKYITHLLRHIKEDSLAPRIGLIYQGHPQLSTLIEELAQRDRWQHISLLAEDLDILSSHLSPGETKSALIALKEAAKKQRRNIKHGYCLQHFARFTLQKSAGVEYMGCRICQSTIFGVQAQNVFLMLDDSMEKETELLPDQILINGKMISQLVDFDHLRIGQCDAEMIRTLCIEMGNETDPIRKKAFESATCVIHRTASLDREIVNLLSQRFKRISHTSQHQIKQA